MLNLTRIFGHYFTFFLDCFFFLSFYLIIRIKKKILMKIRYWNLPLVITYIHIIYLFRKVDGGEKNNWKAFSYHHFKGIYIAIIFLWFIWLQTCRLMDDLGMIDQILDENIYDFLQLPIHVWGYDLVNEENFWL